MTEAQNNTQDVPQHILYEVEDRVAKITVNRPRYRNSQSTPLLFQLDEAIMRAGRDRDVRVIVLSGAGDHWSAGHDLGTPEQAAYKDEHVEDGVRGFFDLTYGSMVETHLRWRNVQKPMICAVQGYCIFGGPDGVASTADIIFASDDALFLGSMFQYFSIPYDIHPRRAKEILFHGRFINAEQARELGLVNRVIPRAGLMEETMSTCATSRRTIRSTCARPRSRSIRRRTPRASPRTFTTHTRPTPCAASANRILVTR